VKWRVDGRLQNFTTDFSLRFQILKKLKIEVFFVIKQPWIYEQKHIAKGLLIHDGKLSNYTFGYDGSQK